jgi:hypothetical protein
VTVRGSLSYADRNNNPAPARFTRVYLVDQDPGGSDDVLATTVTDGSGIFYFPAILNWDEDGTESNPENRRLDLYFVFEADHNDSPLSRRRVTDFSGRNYIWSTVPLNDIGEGMTIVSAQIPRDFPTLPAMWIFQDLRRAWEYVSSHAGLDPGSVTARWEKDKNCYRILANICNSFFWPYYPLHGIFISNEHAVSADTVVHELAHQYMYNAMGWWYWSPSNWDDFFACVVLGHDIFVSRTQLCAWTEGWANFLPLVVNGDRCYDFRTGPCSGVPDRDHYDLETHSRSDDPQRFPWGDTVEGRVAGALYDLFDSTNEGFDSATFGFAPIARIVLQAPHEDRLLAFWNSWKAGGWNKHHAVRAIYQNTIDYNTPPRFAPLLPDRTLLQGFSWPRAIDLWEYAVDEESADWEMDFRIANVTDWRCRVSLEGNRWINLAPIPGWLGRCDVTIQVSDSLRAADDTFQVNVVPVRARVFLPLVLKNRP